MGRYGAHSKMISVKMIWAWVPVSVFAFERKIACLERRFYVTMQAVPQENDRMPSHVRVPRGGNMKKAWKKPKIVEIAVGMEINSYACAELKK